MLDYTDNIFLGCVSLAMAFLLVDANSSIGYAVFGISAYFIIVGAAEIAAQNGTMQIVDYRSAMRKRQHVSAAELILAVGTRMAKNSRSFAVKGPVVREQELLEEITGPAGRHKMAGISIEEIRRTVAKLDGSGVIHSINSAISTKEFSYADQVARYLYDAAVLEEKFVLERTRSSILSRNSFLPYSEIDDKTVNRIMSSGHGHIAVPSGWIKMELLSRASRPDKLGALISLGIASKTLDVVVCL